jgi:hypothetical protein
MGAPRQYATSSELGEMFGTTSKYANEWLNKAGVKPAKAVTVNNRHYYKWRLVEALPAMQAHRDKIDQGRAERALRMAEMDEMRKKALADAHAAAAAEEAGREAERLQAEQEAVAAAQMATDMGGTGGINIDAAHKPAQDDGPNYAEAQEESEALSAAYVLREMREIKTLLTQLLDAVTTPQGAPR